MLGEAFGWIYGIAIVTYILGTFASMWRLHRFYDLQWNLEFAAVVALIVGWPTGLRVQNRLRAGTRDVSTLVNPRTRPLLVAFSVVFVPFMAAVLAIPGDWKMVITIPLALIGLGLALLTWILDARWHPLAETPT